MSSGPTRASSRAANGHGDERPRVSGPSASFRSERAEAYNNNKKAPSPQPGAQFASTSHKRSASGNPRPASRTTTEERRYEERRVTERTYEAHISRLVPRTNSADKEVASTGGSKERKGQESRSHKPSESRSKAPETNQGKYWAAHPRQSELENVRLTQVARTMETRSHVARTYDCTPCLAGVITTPSVGSTPGTTADALT